MASMKRCPSFSARPGFPKGLQVLVLDFEIAAGAEAEAQLKDCGYSPVTCHSSQEAIQHLTNVDRAFDLLLVDVQCLAHKTLENIALLAAAKTLPLVLMSTLCSPADIMVGIKRGAVDFLEKPLHMHKLRNIWQHVVRKMMNGEALPSPAEHADNDAQAMVARPCSRGASVNTEDCSGESASNESTSEHAIMKSTPMDMDIETSSLVDAVDRALGNPLAGLTSGFSNLLMGDQTKVDRSFPTGINSSRKPAAGTAKRTKDLWPTGTQQQQQQQQVDNASRSCSGLGSRKAVTGYPAGQLPTITVSGMEWGLPTNPLQITPKISPLSPLPLSMSMPWLSPLMPSPSMMMPSLFGLNPCTMLPGMMHAPFSRPAPVPTKQTDIMAGLFNIGPAAPEQHLPRSMSHPQCSTGCDASLDFMLDLESSKSQLPPIGLQLKKSISFMDMISQSLTNVL